MNNMVIYHRDKKKFITRAALAFAMSYSIYFAIGLIFQDGIFFISFPIIIFLGFLLVKKILLNITSNEAQLTFKYLRLLFIETLNSYPISEMSFSYQQEQTSRLARNYVLKIYHGDCLVFSRYHDFDGINNLDVDQIISGLKSAGIPEKNSAIP